MIFDQASGLRNKKRTTTNALFDLGGVKPANFFNRNGAFCFFVPSDMIELVDLYREIKSVIKENNVTEIILIAQNLREQQNAKGVKKTLDVYEDVSVEIRDSAL